MLWEQNLTCYYHYLLPALINGSITFYFLRNGPQLRSILNTRTAYSGFIILSVFLSIFSNIFSSIILAVTCGSVLLVDLIQSKFMLSRTMNKYPLHILVIAMWIVSAIFEANGGRAERMGKSSLDISGVINKSIDLFSQMNVNFAIVIFLGFAACFYGCIINGKKCLNSKKTAVISILSLIIIFTALILISAKSSPNYIGKPVVLWGVLMYMIACSSFGLSSLLKSRYACYLAPIIILILLNSTTNQIKSLKYPLDNGLTYSKANAVTQNMIDQIQSAVSENKKEMILIVPFSQSSDNWPIPVTRGREISWTLKSNGVIDRNISIKIQPDKEMNKKFDIAF